jgi:hypothetical protein
VNREPLKNNSGEFAATDEKVAQLLSAMKRVEAPNDFDFKVRARIAAGRPATRPVFGIPVAVRYAVPLVLLVLIGAFFGFNAFYANKQAIAPVVAEKAPPVAAPAVVPPANNVIAPSANPMTEEHAAVRKTETVNNTVVTAPAKKQPGVERPGSANYVDAGREERHLYPRGIDPNAKPAANTRVPDGPAQIPAKEILNLFGVNGAFGGSGWKVESVGTDTLAGRSGVKAGDVIEAINDQPLTEKMSLKGGFNGKTLRVRRDGTSIQIVLKN